MSRHPNRPCQTTVSPYGSHFFPNRPPQFQWLCEGCGAIESGFPTEAAATIAGHNHAGVDVEEATVEDVDRLARVRAQQAATIDALPDFVL